MNLEVGITKHGDGDGSVPCPEFFESHPSRFITQPSRQAQHKSNDGCSPNNEQNGEVQADAK